jgi:hypothetical protein
MADAAKHLPNTASQAPSRALICCDQEQPIEPGTTASRNARPSAVFIAHLIAAAQHCPQTRRLRRGEAGDAAALYAAGSARGVSRKLQRSM